jgi:hypothetical protein
MLLFWTAVLQYLEIFYVGYPMIGVGPPAAADIEDYMFRLQESFAPREKRDRSVDIGETPEP